MRPSLPFRSVNRYDRFGYNPGLQRHHILPVQLLTIAGFTRFLKVIGRQRIGFDDFRHNGLLLPASEKASVMMGLPLHRGPHRIYNAVVIERVGQIEWDWARKHGRTPDQAAVDALFRLRLLQAALRRRLLDPRGPRFALNHADPAVNQPDYSELDAMADVLWTQATIGQPG